ncbi:putative DNA binding domain-containing protein [Parabacteroides faecis]|uniref:RNA-binding domain-containing protein n=1 Tax=Parabacteroides TaxID=375288 RepID=UPI000EFF3FD5|nr:MULTISPECIES: RNA-binding domain-containing protein [Parabacteroides]MBC8616732.1 putative DNA binding domain-containing protein [Parabacteroides faecis]RHR98141.1 transcriptional regulator [Parabacteroides sp. AF14-59]
MNSIRIYELFEKLRYHYEDEVIEFKKAENNFDFDDLGKYFSALSNEANLRNQEFAWLVFGVHDKTREVVGTSYKNSSVCLQRLKQDLAQHTIGNNTFREIFDLQIEGKRILLFQIPAAPNGIPIAWKGHFYGRHGESLVALDMNKYDEIRRQTIVEDWSSIIIPEATIEDLDKAAIVKARIEFKKRNPKYNEEVDEWSDAMFLNKAKLTKGGKITNATIVLLGKEESEHFINPAVAKIRWNLKTLDNQDKDFEIFSIPFLLAVEEVFKKIRNLKLRYILDEKSLFPEELLRYEPFNIRELIQNCIAHQDYTKGARINVVEFEDDHLVFSNYGSFIPCSVETVIENDSPEEYYRNPFLVEAMRNLNMIDTQGGGIRKIFNFQRSRLFPMPDYDLSNDKVKATLTGRIINEDFAHILYNNPKLSLSDIMVLDKVQKKQPVSVEEYKKFKKMGFIEGRKPNIYLSSKVLALTDDERLKAQYIKNKSFDDNHFKELILSYLKAYHIGTKAALIELLIDKLSDSLSEEQKVKKVTNLLSALKREGKIKSLGYSKWGLD